jgi:hypothetical protein
LVWAATKNIGISGVEETGHVVVDGLVDSLALLHGLDLLVHELEVLGLGGEGSDGLLLATKAIKAMVVVQADDSRHVADEGVGVGVAACTASVFLLEAAQTKKWDATSFSHGSTHSLF